MTRFTCETCGKLFTNSANFKRHWRNFHKTEGISNRFKCDLCKFVTTRSDSLKRHKFNHHENPKKKAELLCVLCSFKTSCRDQISDHFTSAHDIVLEHENIHFNNVPDFEIWKENLENNEYVQFPKQYSFRTERNVEKIFFACFRDGCYVSTAKYRHEKALGSNKINGHCPAKMKVTIKDNGRVDVHYQKVHVGHENEVRRLRLSKYEREELARSISNNIPFEGILEEVRSANGQLERKNLVSRKDLHNIVRDYNLGNQTVRHSNNYMSVHEWVGQMQNKDGVVLFYKEQGEYSERFPELSDDCFLLVVITKAQRDLLTKFGSEYICIDSTDGDDNCDFAMTTLVILDDNHQAFPCSFMFSNTVNVQILTAFLSVVSSALVHKIAPVVFMSNMEDHFYNAWVNVMEPPEYRFFSPWNVDHAWKKNLEKIKGGRSTQAQVYKLLTTILEEPDQNVFNNLLFTGLEYLKSDPNIAEFGNYFETQFASKPESWATCYRSHLNVNINNNLKKMHEFVKHLNTKKINKIETALHTITKFLTINDEPKNKICSKLSKIEKRHDLSVLMDECVLTQLDENTWELVQLTEKDCEETYQVKKIISESQHEHEYICSCCDSSVDYNMCKHIHFVIGKLKLNANIETHEIQPEDVVKAELKMQISPDEGEGADLEQEKTNLLEEFIDILNGIESLESLEHLRKVIRSSNDLHI